jgi:Flp pilus assembly protein TadB
VGTAATDLVRLRAVAGVDLGDPARLAPRAQRAVRVATTVGAPLLDALDGAAAAEDDARRAERAVAVASAQTRAVVAGLLFAPVLLVPGLGRLVGADLLGFYGTPLGVTVGAAGITLLLTGGLLVVGLVRRVGRAPTTRPSWTRWAGVLLAALAIWWVVHPVAAVVTAGVLVARGPTQRRAHPVVAGADEAADLAAIALAGGSPPGEALRVAAAQLPGHAPALSRLALELELGLGSGSPTVTTAGNEAVGLARLRAVLVTAADVGAPAAPALRRLARDLRADELARILAAAERLPAQLTFPTALCLLPATLLLVGAPMVHVGLAAAAT